MPNRNVYTSERKAKLWQRIGVYKQELGCQSCGYDKCAQALDFHHVDPNTKRANVSDLVSRGCGWKTIVEEISKCVVLCKNCHAEEESQIKIIVEAA